MILLLALLPPLDLLICKASSLDLTDTGGTIFGFPTRFPLKDLEGCCNTRAPLELALKGFGSFKIVRADDPIGNSILFTPGFEHVIVLKFVASDATEEMPLPPRNTFLFTVGIDDDFSVYDPCFGVPARNVRFGLMSAFKHDDPFASFSILWVPRSLSSKHSLKLVEASSVYC